MVHFCKLNFSFVFKPKEVDSGKWKPDAEKEECGQDLNLSFIYCDDTEHDCIAKRNEFTYMVLT